MSCAKVAAFLKETIGLDAASIGSAAIARAVRMRCEAYGILDESSYWKQLVACEREQQQLIQSVVVGETWFFRDRQALTALAGLGATRSLPESVTRPLRILSVPCSSGEEPYSIAMSLLDAGYLEQQFVIDGIDVSSRAIGLAERGVYGKNSFRSADLSFRDRYFEESAQGFRLTERVRKQVHFRQANLLSNGAFAPDAQYDAIFCRNVLIYFDAAARQRAIDLLHRLLLPTGMLFVGPAEGALFHDQPFRSAQIPLAFAFRWGRADTAAKQAQPGRPVSGRRRVSAVTPVVSAPSERSAPVAPSAASLLEQARSLANEGKFAQAMDCCETHLKEHAHSIDGLYLAGLLCDASGQHDKAREYYRRVLYLDPAHYEVLVHLGESLKAAGDLRSAEQLFERARRVQSRGRSA